MERITCTCGEPLVEDVTDAGVRPVGATEVVAFRRTTDYVMCTACLKTYGVRSLIARVRDREVIDRLERIASEQTRN
jgi:Trk K+ transport system NAD-binding subunit